MSPAVKVFGCRPHEGGAAHSGAGVRKPPREMLWGGGEDIASIVADVKPKSDIRLFFHTALTREAARSRPARLKWSHLLNTSATTLRRYSLNILKELGKV